jgi:heme/copper-type cytochrome/quinol oxidase subunit 4
MNIIIYILMVVVTIVPIYVVYLDVKHSEKSTTRTFGNVCAGIWIAIQIGILIIFGFLLL